MTSNDILPLAVALLIAIPALGSCIGVGMAAMKMLEGCALVTRPDRRRADVEAPLAPS